MLTKANSIGSLNYEYVRYTLVKDLQGNVIGLADKNGNLAAKYTYDAWGNILSVTDGQGNDVSGNPGHIANVNPLRYRGYYFDQETGFYYLHTRYYDPKVGRFINADGLLNNTHILGYNMFAYCCNNPVMMSDPNGDRSIWDILDEQARIANSIIAATSNPKKDPPDHPGYTPPKKGNKKVKNPNGKGTGWEAKDGGVWVWTPGMHGGDGWTIQYPGGSHSHAYPGGGVRNHFQPEQSPTDAVIMIFVGTVVTIGLIADDFTGIGVADNPLISGSVACIVGGINGICGKKVCTECGEIRYGP